MPDQTDDDFFAAYPITHYWRLARGREVSLPFYCKAASQLVIHGAVNGRALEVLLAGEFVRPVLDQDTGRSPASIWLMDYRDTTCGAYREAIFAFPAVHIRQTGHSRPAWPEGANVVEAGMSPGTSLFVWRLWLDDQFAIDVGREVWGLTKEPIPCPVEFDFSDDRFTGRVADATGHRVVAFDIGRPADTKAVPIEGELEAITPIELGQRTYQFAARSQAHFAPFGAHDRLDFGHENRFAHAMSRMEFSPQIIQFSDDVRFICSAPTNARPA